MPHRHLWRSTRITCKERSTCSCCGPWPLAAPCTGIAISERIQLVSRETLRVEEGSLYPALHRMEEAGWIASEWGASDNNRRARYYTITRQGRRQLADAEAKWDKLS